MDVGKKRPVLCSPFSGLVVNDRSGKTMVAEKGRRGRGKDLGRRGSESQSFCKRIRHAGVEEGPRALHKKEQEERAAEEMQHFGFGEQTSAFTPKRGAF